MPASRRRLSGSTRKRLLLILLPVLAAPAAPPPAGVDPTLRDFADPFVLREQGTYFAFATGHGGEHVQVARSTDLATWTALPDALPALPRWAARVHGLTWAPSVLRRGDRWVLYYTTRDAASGFQCISRATAAAPEGPYVDDTTRAFVCQVGSCGSIDPSPFTDESGRAYLLWKSDENHERCRTPARIWSQSLTPDGLDVVGAPAQLLVTDAPWEAPLVEGPSMVSRGGRHYLFYSANWYEGASYAIGYATCDSPLGPCKKATVDGPLVKSAGGMLGPGGQEPFTAPDGTTWMAYHAWTAPRSTYAEGGARSLRVGRLGFEAGVPSIELR